MASAYSLYVAEGRRLTSAVAGRLLWGLFPFVIGFWWVFGFSYTMLWPVIVIFVGVNMIFKRQ